MIETLLGAGVGIGAGMYAGKFAIDKVLFSHKIYSVSRGNAFFKYAARAKFLKGMFYESRTLLAGAVSMLTALENNDMHEFERQKKDARVPLQKLSNYYEPMQKVYLADTGLEQDTRYIISSIKQLYGNKKYNLSSFKEKVDSLVNHYSKLSGDVSTSKTLLWI